MTKKILRKIGKDRLIDKCVREIDSVRQIKENYLEHLK